MSRTLSIENPYYEIFVKRFPEWILPLHDELAPELWRGLWDQWRWEYSHGVPTNHAVSRIAAIGRPVVELGAGSGYWSWLLEQAGVLEAAYDSFLFLDGSEDRPPLWRRDAYKPWCEVAEGGPSSLEKHPGTTLLLCWPDHEAGMIMDAASTKFHSGDWLVYVGEMGPGSSTGSDEFFQLLEDRYQVEEWIEIPRWPTNRDGVFIYRRKRWP
jgi:hypothetical protein